MIQGRSITRLLDLLILLIVNIKEENHLGIFESSGGVYPSLVTTRMELETKKGP